MITFPEYDGLGLAELVRKKEISAVELVEAAIQRIETHNPQLNAVITKLYDTARETAQKPLAAATFEFMPWTPVFNVTGQPAMSVPLHWNAEGLPIGMHFIGKFGDEATLFRLAGQLKQARPWADKAPAGYL